MDIQLYDWLTFFMRWLHVITAIAWIGASFYFIWLDLSLETPRPEQAEKGFIGELWAIHGGGIYEVGKYKLNPAQMPERLHWFKWEAYSTWLTGSALLVLVYYVRAQTYLIGPDSAFTTAGSAIIGSVAYLGIGLAYYELVMRTPFGARVSRQIAALVLLVCAASWVAFECFAPRAAIVHVGALLATLMAANVFLSIIPSQKALIRAIDAGRAPDPRLGQMAKERSTHNNYFTLPVVFCMLANHAPFVFGHPHAWLLVIAIAAVAAVARHFFNLKHRGQTKPGWLLGAAIGFFAIIVGAAATDGRAVKTSTTGNDSAAQSLNATDLEARVAQLALAHCAQCHATAPSFAAYTTPPGGYLFTTPTELRAQAPLVLTSLQTNYMPLGNLTGLTDTERSMLIQWVSD